MLPTPGDDFTIILDSCVLVPPFLRDLLLNLCETGVFTVRLSEAILAEVDEVLRRPKFNVSPDKIAWLLAQIRENFEDCFVEDYQTIQISGIPDPRDVHIVQAAIKAKADLIVSYNLKHFPESVLQPLGIEAQSPDILLESVFDLYPEECLGTVEAWLAKNRFPPQTRDEFLRALANHQLTNASKRAAKWLWS